MSHNPVPIIVVIASMSVGLTGCFSPAKNLNVMQMGPPYQVTVFSKGQVVSDRKLDPMSHDEQVIAQWIAANREGWVPTSGNPPPGRVVKAEGFTLNFTDDTCYLFIPPDSKPNPKTKKVQTEPILMRKRLTPGDIELAQVLGS